MKASLSFAGAAVLLCFASGAYSQSTDATSSPAQPMAQHPAQSGSAYQPPSGTSMDGARMGTYQGGSRTGSPCITGLSCDIYQGS